MKPNNDLAAIVADMDTSVMSILIQGAEARVYRTTYDSRPAILKERFRKQYRHPDLDEALRTERIKAESRALIKCQKIGLRAPVLFGYDLQSGRILMSELVAMETTRDFMDRHLRHCGAHCRQLVKLAAELGTLLACMHNERLIHGDLTTSNIMIDRSTELCSPPCTAPEPHSNVEIANNPEPHSAAETASNAEPHEAVDAQTVNNPEPHQSTNAERSSIPNGDSDSCNQHGDSAKSGGDGNGSGRLALVDFGLSVMSVSAEATAVELHVMEQALLSTHGDVSSLIDIVLEQYRTSARVGEGVLQRLEKVRQRGRKRSMVG